MEASNKTKSECSKKRVLNIRINDTKRKLIKIKLDKKDEKNNVKEKYTNTIIGNKENNESKINYDLYINANEKIIKKDTFLLNVKYYLKPKPFIIRLNEKPFYSYIDKIGFNKNDIIKMLEREKINFYRNTVNIKIKREGEKYFEKIKQFNNETINKFVTLEISYNEMKQSIKISEQLNNELARLKRIYEQKKILNKKYDLIYLYASPIFKELSNDGVYEKISYREEVKEILDIIKKKQKEFRYRYELFFQCASDNYLKYVLENMKTKILHISSHGVVNKETNKYKLVLESQENCGKKLVIEEEMLIKYFQSNQVNLENIDLVVLLSCFSERFKNIIIKYCKNKSPKYIIYVKKIPEFGGEIKDKLCILFTKYFYKELLDGNSIYDSFKKAKENLQKDGSILSLFNSENGNNDTEKALKEIDKLQIIEVSQISQLQKKDISQNKNKENEVNKEIEKMEYKPREQIYPFDKNKHGKLNQIKNVIANFNPKKYISILGRVHIINKILQDLKEQKCRFTIIYGHTGSEILNFAEALSVYIFEREVIQGYKIFNEFVSKDVVNYIKSIKIYNRKKIIISIRIWYNEDLIEDIIKDFKKYKNFYFLLILDKESIKNHKIDDCNFFNSLLEIDGAKKLFQALCPNEKIASYAECIINTKYPRKKEEENYDPKIIEKLYDSFKANNYNVELVNINLNQNNDEYLLNLSLDNPLYGYLFLLSKMPLGLPNSFLYLIFNINLTDNLVSVNSWNNWNYINKDGIDFEYLINNNKYNQDKKISFKTFEKNSMIYMLKALKIYCQILYSYIIKNRDKIIYPDEKVHFIFNSYNNEGIWKSDISNLTDTNDINENEFLNNDFNIKNHAENINNLINYLVDKIEYFGEQPIYIEYIKYLLEIILLFPSYFFLKKICISYIKKYIYFCNKCIEHFEKNPEKLKSPPDKRNNLDVKNDNIIEDLKFDEDLKLQVEDINKKWNNLKNEKEINKDNYEIWKEKFNNQKSKLLIYLYSISSEKINIPLEELNSELTSELKILESIKSGDINKLKNLLNNTKMCLSPERKALLCYELSRKYYSKGPNKAIDYLNRGLKLSNENKILFLQHRINIDLCYIFLKEYLNNYEREDDKSIYYSIIQEKINLLNDLIYTNEFPNNVKLKEEKIFLCKRLSELIKPNVIMLNSNPLNNGFSVISNGINAFPNNQYYILEELMQQENMKKIQSDIKIKSYILNEENLKDSLKKSGEILIIQSDDFTEDGDIVLESEEGISRKLNSSEFLEIFNSEEKKIIKYKIVILCFFNSSKFVDLLENNKIEYENLIYFKSSDDFDKYENDNKYFEFNRFCVEFIIYFISNFNDEGDFNDNILDTINNFNDEYKKDNKKCLFKVESKYRINLNIKLMNSNKKGIFFFDPLLYIQKTNFTKNINVNNYANEMLEIIKEIKDNNNIEIKCNELTKEKYKKIGIEIVKYFYRHKTFLQYFIMDFENKNIQSQLELMKGENKNKFKTNRKSKYFYLIYNYKPNNQMENLLDYFKKSDISLMIISVEKNFYNKDVVNNIDNDSYEDYDVDFSEYTVFDHDIIF